MGCYEWQLENRDADFTAEDLHTLEDDIRAMPATEIARRSLSGPALAVRQLGPEDLLDAFLSGRKKTTLDAYDRDLRDFARFLDVTDSRAAVVALVSGGHGSANALALAYRANLTEKGLAAATICRRLAALRSVVKLARQLGQIPWALDVESPKVEPYRDTRGPGDEGWEKIRRKLKLEAAFNSKHALRDRAIVRLIHDLGVRVGSVVGLDLEHVEVEYSFIQDWIPVAVWLLNKGKTTRELRTLPAAVAEALAAWLEIRGPAPGPLFHRLDNAAVVPGRLTTRSVERMVAGIGRRAGLTRAVWPHALRHHAITSVLDRTDGDIRAAKKFSGHSKYDTLALYDDQRRDVAGEMSRLISDGDE